MHNNKSKRKCLFSMKHTHTSKKNELTVQLLINKIATSLSLYMSEYNTAVEKLSKHDYDSWKLQIETILVKTDLWNFVTRDETKQKLMSRNCEMEIK
ncbi:hypothetical protein CEXT_575581 [Caerostris extrusa]|uniref:Uncharacterized protein n=1 Tax=Caerostris extrusa TaxID=172846 RepID=A0AAV4X0T3_CAEEX|nr:hypothetical protein CEXT_575581 [Caerostris extrusa]